MGVSGIGTWELVVILLVALMLFGTKRLRTLGRDLGEAIKSFREAMSDSPRSTASTTSAGRRIAAPSSEAASPAGAKNEAAPRETD
ncbi:MAG TPA: twin-arginine translocase TatA/TatE family subunit [Gammaproteobacteria bacterium]